MLWLHVCTALTVCHAQLSDLHYLPPLKQGANNETVQQQAIYLATPETTAFTVNVYRGTSATPLTSFSLSNSAPIEYTLPNGDNDITLVTNANTGVVLTNSGLRFQSSGGQKFYVNYRGYSSYQATSLTSKGREAMGTLFKWGGMANLGAHVSKFTTLGIMATQNNTTVDIYGYDPNCEFRLGNNAGGITADTYQVVLQANESFVFEAYLAQTTANLDGWLGATISADKNIVISNGGLNVGRQAGSGNRDAAIDQPVPEDKLGDEYIFIRGNGVNSTEFPIIIGTVDNTEIYVNGSATPIATINNGDYFEILGSNYSSGSAGANMYVFTSENVYAYQCMAGSSQVWTIGLNFITPVNCEMPDTVDHIPDIRNVAGINMSGGVTVVASSSTPDSNISVTDDNGAVTLPASQTISGTPDWKTFYIPNLTGDVTVQSTGPIAVGFVGFSGFRGVAGYFSGFDLVPSLTINITASITCIPSSPIEIQEDETFDGYQWYKDGTEIAGATNSSFTPTEVGTYQVEVIKGPCSYFSNTLFIRNCSVITNSRITYRIKKD